MANFNDSLTISPLLSELDVMALHAHFLQVELARMEKEIVEMEEELETERKEAEIPAEKMGWPIGVKMPEKAPNRFQVPIWRMVNKDWTAFGTNPDENMARLEGNELEEWSGDLLGKAKRTAKCPDGKMQQAYRQVNKWGE
jgi:hypothetical protein